MAKKNKEKPFDYETYRDLLTRVPTHEEAKAIHKTLAPKIRSLAPEEYYNMDSEKLWEYAVAYSWDAHISPFNYGDNTPNIKDLNNLLKVNTRANINAQLEIGRGTNGLKFLNYYVKEYLYNTEIGGRSKTMIEAKDDISFVYKVVIKLMYHSCTNITRNNIYSFFKIASIQVPSNFKPAVASVLWDKLGIQKLDKDATQLNILCPSEGWVSRCLSSYKIAHDNPHIKIRYHTIDPNPQVKVAYNTMTKFLKNFGGFNRVKNWETTYHFGGSQDIESIPTDLIGSMDVVGTSPPYFGITELYGFNIALIGDNEFDPTKGFQTDHGNMMVEDLPEFLVTNPTADSVTQFDKEFKIIKTNDLEKDFTSANPNCVYFWEASQASNIDSYTGWQEEYLRPTITNAHIALKENGYLWINVANSKGMPTFEDDVTKIVEECGFEHVETYKMLISRSPALKDKTKNKPFEPIFIFKKR